MTQLVSPDAPDDSQDVHPDAPLFSPGHIVIWALLVEGSLGAAGLVLAWWFELPILSLLEWDVASFAWGTIAAIPLTIGFVLFHRNPIGSLRRIKEILNETLLAAFGQCSVLELGLIALSAGVGEELFFRGYLQVHLSELTGNVWIGLAVASVLFGLAHMVTYTYAILATLIGALLGWMMMATGGLIAPIVAHALYDFLALVYAIKLVNNRRARSELAMAPSDEKEECEL